MVMKQTFAWVLKAVAVWLALMVGTIVGGLVAPIPVQEVVNDGPLTAQQAMPVINAIFAVVMAALAARLAGTWWRKALILFAVVYGVETVLSLIEAVYFNAYLKLPEITFVGIAIMNAIKTAFAAVAAGLLWRSARPANPPVTGLAWKAAVIIPLYVVCYFTAGALIAWQSAAVRAYYLQGFDIDQGQLALLQLGRGAIWLGLVWLIVRHVRGSAMSRIVLTGAALSVFMASSLLYPTGFMPWAVRSMHMAEVGVSNFVFGALAAMILLTAIGARRAPAQGAMAGG
jgi:hypothetical protein